jgi:predicted Zn-dependent peptidase
MKEVEFYRKKLDNGLTVLFEKRKAPVVAVSTSVKFGAQYEPRELKGISHFIEHLVFKGTKNRNVTQISQEIESKGGIINAFTGEEVTGYWDKLPSKHFSLGADITRDLILNPLFNQKALEMERKVILEEIKMYHDNPSTHVIEKIKEMLYKPPFNMSIAGTAQTVSNLSREKVLDIFHSVYTTNNLVFSIVGKASWEEVLMEAQKFPKIFKEIKSLPIILSSGECIEKRKGIDQAHEVIGFHRPRLGDPKRYAAEVFNAILGGGMSSRLFQEIREKRGLCYSVRDHLEQSKDYSYEMIYFGTVKEKIKQIKQITLNEIKKLGKLNPRDLDEAKEKLIGLRQISKEKTDLTMMGLLQEEIGGNAKEFYSYEERINKTRLADVRSLAKLGGYSFVALIPAG